MAKTKRVLFGVNNCNKPRTVKYETPKRPPTLTYSNIFKTIVLFPHHLGQTKLGVEKTPNYLRKFIRKNHRVYAVKNTGDLFKNIQGLYAINKRISGPRINIGGDHTMAIATIADTLNRHPNAKVIYFDAHADINTLASSESKHYHGMPLSFITGIDRNKHFDFIRHHLKFGNLLYVGGRCWDAFERDLLYKKRVKHIDPKELNTEFENAVTKILAFAGDSPIHLSFDVDCMDIKYIPSTGTAVAGGIELGIGERVLRVLKERTNIVNVDITELNLSLGTKRDISKSAKNTMELFQPLFQ